MSLSSTPEDYLSVSMGWGCYGAGCIIHGRGNARPGTTFTDHWPFQTRHILIFPSQGPPAGWNGLRMYGAGCIVHGRGNARPGTAFADHWLHCPLQTRQVLLLHSRDHSSLALLVLPCPTVLLLPDASTVCSLPTYPRVFTPELLLSMLRLTTSFHARSGWLTPTPPPSDSVPTARWPRDSRRFSPRLDSSQSMYKERDLKLLWTATH